jgi:hypothetical protein
VTPAQLQALQPGDRVAYEGYGGRWWITTVDRVLATQIVTADGARWTRKGGVEVRKSGRSYGGLQILAEATPERVQAAAAADEHVALARRLGGVDWSGRDLATLRAVVALLDGGGA